MTTPVDLVVHHVGGLLQAALNAFLAGTCDTVEECQPFHGAPTVALPCLSIWRESEKPVKRVGTGGKLLRTVILKAVYEIGPRGPTKIVESTAILADVVGVVGDTLEDERCATYPAAGGTYPPGTGLNTLASVTGIGLTGTRYGGAIVETPAGPYPCVEMTIECEYEHSRYVVGTTLVDLLGTVNTSTGLETLSIGGGGMTMTPLVAGVVVVLVWGVALDVDVVYRTVTITMVGGTTTLAQIIAAITADPEAVALLVVGGTLVGPVPVEAPGTTHTFGLSIPRAKQISTPT